jgi:hypothetical protein
MPEDNKTCATCRWFSVKTAEIAQCRRNTPTEAKELHRLPDAGWPYTGRNRFCGEWTADETPKQPAKVVCVWDPVYERYVPEYSVRGVEITQTKT